VRIGVVRGREARAVFTVQVAPMESDPPRSAMETMATIVPKVLEVLEASVRVQEELAQQGIEVKPAPAIKRLGKRPWREVDFTTVQPEHHPMINVKGINEMVRRFDQP
jgi:hypothetical protein